MKEEIFIPSSLSEELEKAASEQGVTADEIAERAIENYLRQYRTKIVLKMRREIFRQIV